MKMEYSRTLEFYDSDTEDRFKVGLSVIEGQQLFFLETKTESCTTSLNKVQLEELKKFVTNL